MAGLKPMSDDRSDEDLGMARMSIETETNQDQMRGPYKALYAKDQGGVILQYKTSVIHRCEFVTEFNLPYDERVKLTARYIEPVIRQRSEDQTKLYSYEHMMHKYAFRTETSPKPLLNRKCHTIGIDQLFSTYSDGKIPKTVILSGNSGSGKSFTLQKIMLDWASGKQHSQNFDVIFLLKCEELMYFSEEMTLIELLSRSCSLTSGQISQMIRHSPERILFLIDGYNEFIYHPPSYSSHQYLGALPMDTLRSLLKGDILPESLLLVSTRSTAAETLNNPFKRPQRFTEMMGFSESGVVEYFQKFFQDEQLFRKAYECVKTNEMLLTACSVPLICWIVCLCLKKHLTDGKDVMRELKTITSIYVHFVSTVLEHHCQSQSVPALLKSLCQLAEKGMLENRVLFDEGTVFETGLDVDSSLFLCKDLLNRNDLNAPVYKFLHLSFQEFFSAVSYALLDEKAQQNTTFRKHQHFGDFIDGISNCISPVVLFLCGLSNEEVSSSLIKKLNWKAFRTLRQNLERKILKLQYPCRPLALQCLYELHQEGFVRAVLADWDFLLFAHISLRTTDCWALLYCLQCCPHIRQLNITHCELTADKLRILQPALCMCEKLRLTVNSLPEVGDLIQALFEQRLLRELHVQEEEYSGEGPRWSLDLSVTHGDSLLFVSCSEKNPLFPSLVKISLICPYSEISSIDWTLFLQRLDKSGNLAEDSSEFDEHVNLLLSSFHSICLKKIELGVVSLTESWASGIISLIQTCTGFSIKKKKYSVKSLFSSLSVSITDNDIRLSMRISKTSMPSLSKLSLICPHSEISIINWKLFFQRVCTARKFSEGSSDFDEHVSLLLSCFDSISLKKMKLTVLSLTESWASGINSFIQTCTGLQELSINEEEESDKSLFSSLSVSVRDGDLTLCLTGRHKLFSEICLTCAYKTCLIICRNILQIFCELPRCEPNSIDSDDMADAMLSCLGSVSELKRLNLMVFWLTEKLAFRILSLIQTSPILQEISVKESHQSCKSLFSSLNVLIRDGNVIMDVRHSWKFELLSKITLTYKHSALSSSDWKIFFQSFHKIIRYQPNSPEFEENVNGLFSFLYSLCGLKRVELMIFSLNKNWALRILSLIHKCSSLQEVCLNVAGLMLEEGLVLLRESLMDPRCTVIIEGRKCNNSIRPCTEEEWRRSCNEKMEICFRPNVLENLKIPDPEPPGLDLHPYQNCQSCVHIVDCNQWVQVEPSVCRDESVLKFRISTQPGHYECTRTRMRWVCDCDVTIQYHPVDGHFLTTELERLQYERIAPVIDVTVISGKLKEAHLPHYACLAKSDPCLKDAVKLLSKKDEGVYLQSVELTRFHAKIVQPSFSFTTLIINWIMQWEEHCNLLLYMRCKDPLILHVYFFPLLDTCLKEKVEQNEKSSLQISHPRPNRPFRMKTTHLLEVPGSSVHPIEGITFRRDIDPNFFKIKQDLNDVHMNLIREEDQTSVWTATIWKDELIQIHPKKSDPHLNREIDKALFFDKHRSALIQGVKNVKSTADKLCEQGIINEEQHSEITHPNLICQDSMRKIFSIVHSGGMMAKAKFIMILREEEPCLLADLTLSDSLP